MDKHLAPTGAKKGIWSSFETEGQKQEQKGYIYIYILLILEKSSFHLLPQCFLDGISFDQSLLAYLQKILKLWLKF